MSVESRIEELRARLSLAQGTPTLLLVVAPTDGVLDEVRVQLLELLQATPMKIEDLGRSSTKTGPALWAEFTQRSPADAHLISFTSSSPLETRAFAILLNAERVLLRELPAPVVLLVSRETELLLRKHALDFATWVAQSYELPEPKSIRSAMANLGVVSAYEEKRRAAEEPIRFLHLSDLHLRPDRVARYDQDRVLRGLVEYLGRDHEAFPLDLVFVTGDLAHKGKADEYALVVELLREICSVTQVPVERLFVVPGNHDVDRGTGRWLLRTLEGGSTSADAFFVEPDARSFHRQKLTAYEQAMRGLLGEGRSLGLGVGAEAVEIVEIRGTRLAVASFNSAWFSQDDGDQGKLWLGEPSVQRAVDRIADDGASFAVALLHHPFEFLHERERDLVERWVERGIDLVLRGHLHSDKTRSIASQRGGYVEVAAPAVYQGSQWGNGCFLGEIRAEAREVRLRPLTYSAGPDPWVLDPKVFPDDADGGYCRTFSVPAKARERSGIAAPRRAAVEAAYRRAPVRARQQAQDVVRTVRGGPGSADEALLDLESSPSLRKEVLGSDAGVALVDTIERETHDRVVLTDFEVFKDVLLRACRLLRSARETLGVHQDQMTNHTAIVGLAAAIGVLVDAPIELRRRQEQGFGPDIVIGRGEARDVAHVVVYRSSMGPLVGSIPRAGEVVRQHSGRFGALVIVDASESQPMWHPAIQKETTSQERPVVVLIM